MLYCRFTSNRSQAQMLIKHLMNNGIKCHLTKDERWYVVLADFNDADGCVVYRITIENEYGVECDYNFGLVTEYDNDYGFYDLPFVSSNFSNVIYGVDYVGGHVKKAEQLKAFGVYFGRMTIEVDFKEQIVKLSRSICFGTDRASYFYYFSELPKLASGEMKLVEF